MNIRVMRTDLDRLYVQYIVCVNLQYVVTVRGTAEPMNIRVMRTDPYSLYVQYIVYCAGNR